VRQAAWGGLYTAAHAEFYTSKRRGAIAGTSQHRYIPKVITAENVVANSRP
jgi:hypothetical protein